MRCINDNAFTETDPFIFSLPSEAFQYDEAKDVNAKEFFGLYRDNFPMMAVVREGYYGSYDTSQVFRIHGYTSQPRVVALDSSEARKQSHKYLTIPVETPIKLRVVKGHKTLGEIQDLETIIEPIRSSFSYNWSRRQNR